MLTHTHRERERERGDKSIKISCFDFFRAIACFCVLFQHFFELHPHEIGLVNSKLILVFCYASLSMFFFTTGYLIPLSLERCNWKQFAVKRIFRLLPVLWFAVFIVVGYYLITGNIQQYHTMNLKNILSTMFIQTDVVSLFTFPPQRIKVFHNILLTTSWSMQVEIKFYIFFALLFTLFRSNKKKIINILSIFAILMLLIGFIYPNARGFSNFSGCWMKVLVVEFGTLIYYYQKKEISKKYVILFSLIASPIAINFNYPYIQYIGYMLGYLICIYFVLKKPTFGNNKFVKFFANISYSMYLLHYLCLYQTFTDNEHYIRYFFICYALLVPICYLIYRFIEKPCYDFGRRLASKIK